MEKITSKSNHLIKEVKKLFTSRKARLENQEFVLEGARLCFDALNSDYDIEIFLATDEAFEKYNEKCREIAKAAKRAYFISKEAADKLCSTETTQGVFAVCKMKSADEKPELGEKYIALDTLQDPSNLGAVIRTGEALGISGAILYNCCDLYNPKALRASMGSILRMPVISSENLVADIESYKKSGFSVYAAVPDADASDITDIAFSGSDICVIGNEGNGISEAVKNASDKLITIHMLGRAESLNASVAAAIAMWEMLR